MQSSHRPTFTCDHEYKKRNGQRRTRDPVHRNQDYWIRIICKWKVPSNYIPGPTDNHWMKYTRPETDRYSLHPIHSWGNTEANPMTTGGRKQKCPHSTIAQMGFIIFAPLVVFFLDNSSSCEQLNSFFGKLAATAERRQALRMLRQAKEKWYYSQQRKGTFFLAREDNGS